MNDEKPMRTVQPCAALWLNGFYRLSEDRWTTGNIANRAPLSGNMTTVTLRHDAPVISSAYFGEPTREVYDIDRVDFAEDEGQRTED